jgi:hypothetical protein
VPGRIVRGARWLALLVAAGAAAVCTVSLMWPSVYRETDPWFRSVWHGNDWVTLVVAVPVLLIALAFALGGSRRGSLVTYGVLGYLVYTYGYYLFGARLNVLFPAYIAICVLAALTLMIALPAVDAHALSQCFEEPVWCEKVSASYMAFAGVGLASIWLWQWAAAVFGGQKPTLGEQAFHVVSAMDLSLVVPFLLLGAVLLWRRHPWGYVVSPIVMTQGVLYTLVLAVNAWFVAGQGRTAAADLYVWGSWTVLGVAALLILLLGVGRRPAVLAEAQE